MKLRIWLYLISIVFSFVLCPSVKYNKDFKNYATDDGLSYILINTVTQDLAGFLWIGTPYGLQRFDGYQFVPFEQISRRADQLSGKHISVLFTDFKGRIWIGTDSDGILIFDPIRKRFVHRSVGNFSRYGLGNKSITTCVQDRFKTVWIGTNEGLYVLKHNRSAFEKIIIPKSKSESAALAIKSLSEDSEGNIWICMPYRLMKISSKNPMPTSIEVHFEDRRTDVSEFTSVLANGRDRLWLGTVRGLVCLKRSTSNHTVKEIPIPSKNNLIKNYYISTLKKDTSGKGIWIGTQLKGFYRYQIEIDRWDVFQFAQKRKIGLSVDDIRCFYQDNSGILWVGTNVGLNKFLPDHYNFHLLYQNPFFSKPHLLDNVHSFAEDSNSNLWIAGRGMGLANLNFEKKTTSIYTHQAGKEGTLSSNEGRSLFIDAEDTIWYGTNDRGIDRIRFDKEGKMNIVSYRHLPDNPESISNNQIQFIFKDKMSRLWVGTMNGLNLMVSEGRFKRFIHDPFNHRSIGHNKTYCYLMLKNDQFWIGTFGGGIIHCQKVPGSDTEFSFKRVYSPGNKNRSLPSNKIISMFEEKAGIIWVGTFDRGLNRIDNNRGTLKVYRIRQGLPSDIVYGIVPDDYGNLWLSTGNGISRFNLRSESFFNFTTDDGLQGNDFNGHAYFRTRNGIVFFGGPNGLNYFDPSEISSNTVLIPPAKITELRILNNKIDVGSILDGNPVLNSGIEYSERIELGHRQTTLSFEFSALNFFRPRKIKYAYYLEGLDTGWNFIGNRRFATFSHLPPGDYTLKYKSSNERGMWSETESSFRIVINPPFWTRWWFYSVSAILLFLSIIVFIKFRLRLLKRREIYLENEVNNRTLELRLANTELKKLSIVASHTQNAILIFDRNGSLIWLNEAFAKLYGLALKQMLDRGNSILELSQNKTIEESFARCLETKKMVVYETLTQNAAGESIWVQTTLTPVLSKAGEIEKFVAIDADITALKRAEQAAESANQAKSDFLARMSHEIRTPMNGIIGFAELLLDTRLNEEQRSFADTIFKSGESLLSLLNDILDFSKIEAGELSFEMKDFDPELTFYDVCDMMMPRIGDNKIELICDIEDSIPPFIRTDPGRFRQIIVNLLGNAVKFTKDGEILIRLALKAQENDKIQLHITVKDTGVGIPENKLESIFNVFQQADKSTFQRFGGSGLGLAICKQIAQRMNGDVWAESTPNVGSTFHFNCWVERSEKRIRKIRTDLRKKSALIVDDNLSNLNLLSRILSNEGMTVVTEVHSERAIDILKQHHEMERDFDIVIIDINMPGLDGYSLAMEIKSLPLPISKTPLLAFSSSLMRNRGSVEKIQFNGFIPKPVRRKRLIEMVNTLVAGGESGEIDGNSEMITQYSVLEEQKHSVHILLVEDNSVNVKLATYMLEKAGYQVSLAINGKKAVERLIDSKESFDLVLMDIQMPVMDGLTAARKIREAGLSNIPIIAMTAESMKGDREKCIDAGMNDYITKPVKRDQVFKIIQQYLM